MLFVFGVPVYLFLFLLQILAGLNRLKIKERLHWCPITLNEHPKKVGQVEVVQENDDDTRALVRLITVQLFNANKKSPFNSSSQLQQLSTEKINFYIYHLNLNAFINHFASIIHLMFKTTFLYIFFCIIVLLQLMFI